MLDRDPQPAEIKASLAAVSEAFDLCLIDTPPTRAEWLNEALVNADLVLIQCGPRPTISRAVGNTLAGVTRARIPFAFVMSQTPRAGSQKKQLASWSSMAESPRSTSTTALSMRKRARLAKALPKPETKKQQQNF